MILHLNRLLRSLSHLLTIGKDCFYVSLIGVKFTFLNGALNFMDLPSFYDVVGNVRGEIMLINLDLHEEGRSAINTKPS